MHGMRYIIISLPLFCCNSISKICDYKACFFQQKCFDESLVYFFFCFLCSIKMNLTYFVVFFPSGTLSFLCAQFVVFILMLWFGFQWIPPHYSWRKNVQVLFHCQFFFRWCFFHDFSQVCLSLRNLPRRYIANLP